MRELTNFQIGSAQRRKVTEMNDHVNEQADDNRHYQEQLARNLVNCLGREGAIHACQANAWDGVLQVLRQRDDAN
jgi:hypothetical protein